LDPSLRPEEFTRQKEERQKAMGVDIITVDPNYRPEGVSAERYQPKVTGCTLQIIAMKCLITLVPP
jgi:hypothetical protein